nr:uncharacterized protein LOC124819038 [Hydra vulgaris]
MNDFACSTLTKGGGKGAYCLWLKNGFTILHTSWLFKISKSTTSRYLITWTNFLYFSLGSVPIWPSREQKPSSLRHQSSLFSSYKHHVTYKGLLGISPSRAITFISQLYDASISDKEIVVRSGFLNKELWNKNDSVMADYGFTISDHLNTINVKINIPSFLNGQLQLSKEDATESQTIASLRIHVEHAIRRIKVFRQISNEITLVFHGSINQLWTLTCLLSSLSYTRPFGLADNQNKLGCITIPVVLTEILRFNLFFKTSINFSRACGS